MLFRPLLSTVLSVSSKVCVPMAPRARHKWRHASAGSKAGGPSTQANLSLVNRLEDSSDPNGQAEGAAAIRELDEVGQRRVAEAVLPGLVKLLEVCLSSPHSRLQTRGLNPISPCKAGRCKVVPDQATPHMKITYACGQVLQLESSQLS